MAAVRHRDGSKVGLTLPLIDAAFERGDLSYSKVRAVSRVATERSEEALLRFALDSTAAQVAAYCRRLRNGDAADSADQARRLHEARSLSRTIREDGSGTLHVELPRADLELVLNALEWVGRTLPEDSTRSRFAKGADALIQMARDALAGRTGQGAAGDNYQVIVHGNLLLLCTAHHTLVHEGGFSIRRHRDGRWYFVRPDGRRIEVGSSSAEDVRGERPIYRLTTPVRSRSRR